MPHGAAKHTASAPCRSLFGASQPSFTVAASMSTAHDSCPASRRGGKLRVPDPVRCSARHCPVLQLTTALETTVHVPCNGASVASSLRILGSRASKRHAQECGKRVRTRKLSGFTALVLSAVFDRFLASVRPVFDQCSTGF
jgi:hypothetical protein